MAAWAGAGGVRVVRLRLLPRCHMKLVEIVSTVLSSKSAAAMTRAATVREFKKNVQKLGGVVMTDEAMAWLMEVAKGTETEGNARNAS